MRIGLTHYAFYPITGGVESHLLDLGAGLVKEGHEVHALVGSLDGSPSFEEIQGIKVHRRDLMNPFYVRERKAHLGLPAEEVVHTILKEIKVMYKSFIDENGIDIIHAHNFHHFLPAHALALTELHDQGLATVLTIHEVWSEFICEDLLERTRWDGIIAVSRHVQEGIREQAPNLQKLHLIYHGIDTTLFSQYNRDNNWVEKLGLKDRPTIIHPARMLPWKGVIYSVMAMEMVRKEFPDAILIITDTEDIIDWIGELKGYKEQVFETIKRLGLQYHLYIQSFPYLELPKVYNHCQVVIYPTIGEEPFGLVPLEAMACAKPVVVTKSGGLVESVIDGETGFIIEKRDVNTLAEKICLLLRDEKLAQQMGEAGRRHVEEHFSQERMVHQVSELYQKVVTKKN